jgi:hypothetical protein
MILDNIGSFNYMKFLKYAIKKKRDYLVDGVNYIACC